MQHYRVYIVTPEENISEAVEVDYRDDRHALAEAARLGDARHAVEVWTGERLVGRLGEAFNFGGQI
ncbi:hypothetical protein [Phenylobacterium sp.]|uniref:hypothetical protein n=1 Tax=Phenylobacterium sp. TaxID=1871053 RepID=UPI00272F9072|nr:hypothetical protein [Phenylobacterium sp.]MDP1875294.1 hypothetical protein [Phenylobacterium sp.]MDP3489778.1 hypothetical protein [Phenylobacterium sp.]